MKGSITFRLGGEHDSYSIRASREGDLDLEDLVAIARMLEDDIRCFMLIMSGEIQSTASDPTGMRRFHEHWSN
jgi:hypothetical protein